MKPVHPPRPVTLTPDLVAKCDAPNQFERFDHMVRTLIALPKAEIDKRDAKWRRARARKKRAKRPN